MITPENLMSMDKEQFSGTANVLSGSDLSNLVDLLAERDDKVRYRAFLLLQYRSMLFDDAYPFWETFRSKLKSKNSCQRSIGIMLIAENARWDVENKMEASLDECMELLKDEKNTTIRQSIQALGKIAEAKPELSDKIADKLMSMDLSEIKGTMRKSVLLDVLTVLAAIRKRRNNGEIDSFIFNSLYSHSGGILDAKAVRQIQALLL